MAFKTPSHEYSQVQGVYSRIPKPFWLCSLMQGGRGWFHVSGGQVCAAPFVRVVGTCTYRSCTFVQIRPESPAACASGDVRGLIYHFCGPVLYGSRPDSGLQPLTASLPQGCHKGLDFLPRFPPVGFFLWVHSIGTTHHWFSDQLSGRFSWLQRLGYPSLQSIRREKASLQRQRSTCLFN